MRTKHTDENLVDGQTAPSGKDGWTQKPDYSRHRIVAVKVLRTNSGTVKYYKTKPKTGFPAKRGPLPDQKFVPAQQPAKKKFRSLGPTKFRSSLRPKAGWPNQRDGWQPEERVNLHSRKWCVNDVMTVTLRDSSTTKTFFKMVLREKESQKGTKAK